MKFSNFLLICVIIVAQFSCKHKVESLTDTERKIVFSATAHTPFRVLQITDKADSLTLRTDCSDLTNFVGDSAFTLLVERLKTTLETEDGVGIAAPQIGINKNLFLFIRLDLPDQPVVVAVNPKIINKPDSLVCFERDGCLSIPDFSGNSQRYPWVEVEYLNQNGEKITEKLTGYSRLTSFTAVIFQHEYDHLRGTLFIDKLCE